MMSEHDGMPSSRLDRDLESKSRQLVAEPLGRAPHVLLVRGIGADAGDAQQIKQALTRLIQSGIHLTEHGINDGGRGTGHGNDPCCNRDYAAECRQVNLACLSTLD